MTKLTEKKRDDAKSLLEDHQKVTDALFNLGKSGFNCMAFVNNEDDNDSTEVDLTHAIAKRALTDQKKWIEEQLAKLEIELV